MNKRVILITGTPCTGKTTTAKELAATLVDCLYINLTEYAKISSLTQGEDKKAGHQNSPRRGAEWRREECAQQNDVAKPASVEELPFAVGCHHDVPSPFGRPITIPEIGWIFNSSPNGSVEAFHERPPISLFPLESSIPICHDPMSAKLRSREALAVSPIVKGNS